jgi:hypothetical protein
MTSPCNINDLDLDLLAACATPGEGMAAIDALRRRIAPQSIFSIQQNVTTARDAAGEVLLRRFHSSEAESFPVNGAKRKTRTPWTECLFVEGRAFIGEGEQVLAQHFDDFEQMRAMGLRSVINVPLMQGTLCYATFNVFGTRDRWLPGEVLGIRLLALAAARWVPAMPGLSYRFTGLPAIPAIPAILAISGISGISTMDARVR